MLASNIKCVLPVNFFVAAQVIVPRQPSGGHKDVKELDLMRKRVKARHVKISLRGRKRSCYNTSVYWTELLGF